MNSEVSSLKELLASNHSPGSIQGAARSLRKAIVTGGSTGIGRYIALALAEDGCDVAITYAHNADDAELTAKGIRHYGQKAYVHKLDLNSPKAAEMAVNAMVDDLGGLDIFVNNAGKMIMSRFPDLQLEELEDIFRVNTFGAVLASQQAARHMLGLDPDGKSNTFEEIAQTARKVVTGKISSPRKTPGRIIIVTSVHEHIASPADTAYTMTKHALGGLIKCAAYSLSGTNITINGVRPGEIATPMNDMEPEDATETNRKYLPSGRVGHPAEIAAMVRFLASDETSFINGMSYDVDGGMSIGEPMAQEMYQKMA